MFKNIYVRHETAFCRGSASKTGSPSARPNDYVEKQKKAPKQKGKKETKETKEKKQKKKTPDTDGQTISNDLHQNNLGFDDQEPFDYQPPINYQYQDPVNYQFAETDLGPNMYNDDKYYPTDSIYTNDPQFQPPLVWPHALYMDHSKQDTTKQPAVGIASYGTQGHLPRRL